MVRKSEKVKRRGGKTDQTDFGEWISLRLEKRGLLQDDLALFLGLGKSSVSGIMNGSRGLRIEQFILMADFFGVSSKELFKAMGIRGPLKG